MKNDETPGEQLVPKLPDEAHENLGDHAWEYSKQDGIHRMKLHHPEGHGIVEVHSARPKSLHAHLESVSIWMRSTAPLAERAMPVGVAPPPDDHYEQLRANEGAVFTRLSPVQEGHDFCFSLRDVGSILAGKHKYYQCWGPWMVVTETLRVTNSAGNMTASIQEYLKGKWQLITDKKGDFSRRRITYTSTNQDFNVFGNWFGVWHMELEGIASRTDYSLTAGWTEADEISKTDWQKSPDEGPQKLT
ncbi:MAG: hypothetical protein QNL91_14820 [Candidatus Krumholzibacteria bacterium]|nr:hypothetical protein [Candidatus Krumholzibacteria bacterium]